MTDPYHAGIRRCWAHNYVSGRTLNRRYWLKFGITSATASLTGTHLHAQSQQQACAPPIPLNNEPSNGGPCPYPIPWLDKNGNHNQPAMPNVELPSIYHFKGKLARWSGFHGMGQTIQATVLPGAHRLPTTVKWLASPGRHARRTKLFSLTHD